MAKFFSVFSGIGLFDLGLEMAGWQCVGQCEIEPFPAAVLEHHWPDVWRYDDVRKLSGELIREHCGDVDAIIGGPPCQPASVAGQRKGSSDDRWLWPDYLRLVSEVKPVWVLAENPGGVLSLRVDGVRFSEWIAVQFKDLGYTLLPILLGAADVGAPHERERVWFMAYSDRARKQQSGRDDREGGRRTGYCCEEMANAGLSERRPPAEGWIDDADRADAGGEEAAGRSGFCCTSLAGSEMANASIVGCGEGRTESAREQGRFDAPICGCKVGNANGAYGCRLPIGTATKDAEPEFSGIEMGDANSARLQEHKGQRCDAREKRTTFERTSWPMGQGPDQYEWEAPRLVESQSALGTAVDGHDRRMAGYWRREAVKAVGNAVVPQISQILAEAINEYERRLI